MLFSSMTKLCSMYALSNRHRKINPWKPSNPFSSAYNMSYDASDYDLNITMSLVNAEAPACPNSTNSEVYATLFNLNPGVNDSSCIEIAVANPTITALGMSFSKYWPYLVNSRL